MLPVLGPKFGTQRQHQWSTWCTASGTQNLLLKWGLRKKMTTEPGQPQGCPDRRSSTMDRACMTALCRVLGQNEEVGGGRQR